MPFRRFAAALCAASVPMGFAFAWIGHAGADRPGLALLLSAAVPPVIWSAFHLARGVWLAKPAPGKTPGIRAGRPPRQ
jgi:hypothetical protein